MRRDGLGADVIIDAAGISPALKLAIDLVRPAGWITKVGWGPKPLDFSIDPLVQKNETLHGSFSHHWTVWERVLALLAGEQLDQHRRWSRRYGSTVAQCRVPETKNPRARGLTEHGG